MLQTSFLCVWFHCFMMIRILLSIIQPFGRAFSHVSVMTLEGYVCSSMSGESDLGLPVAAGNDK